MPNQPGAHTDTRYIAPHPRRLYERLESRGLIWTNPRFTELDTCSSWEEARAVRQLRFRHVVDPDTGDEIVELEHETRALRHFQYHKPVHYCPR
jgi:hypothetical protein